MAHEGWRTKTLASVLERVVYSVKPEAKTQYQEIGIRSHGKGIFHKKPVLGEELGDKRVFKVVPDCLVVNIVFAWEQAIARTTAAEQGMIASHRFPMYRPKGDRSNVDFLVYFFKSKRGKYLLELASPGGAGRNKTLGQKEFERLSLPMPSGVEQAKIATILATWDKAIEVTEKLIANSKAQKKALMQRLLTGRKRLPGFDRKWREVAIRSMGKIVSGGTPDTGNASYWDGDVLWATPTDITSLESLYIGDTKRKITEEGVRGSSVNVLPVGSILFCTRATIGELAVASKAISTNQGFKNLIPKPGFSTEFLCYLFQYFKNDFLKHSCGSTFLELSKKDFEKRVFSVPEIDEQEEIAKTIASAAESHRLLVSRKRALLKERASLSQQLLTGKRRVNLDSAA